MAQLVFDWPVKVSYAACDFIISECNQHAAEFLDSWPARRNAAALLSGPKASGKTHLAHRWAERVGGVFLESTLLGKIDSATLWGKSRYGVLENIHTVSDETALFHVLRHAETHDLALLMTADAPAQKPGFTLPDLRSRLIALPEAHIDAPDETLLAAYLAKGFADRQLPVDGEVITYLTRRMERSFAAASELVERIAKTTLATKRAVTIPLVKSLMV